MARFIDPATLEAARQIIAAAEQAKTIDISKLQNDRLDQALEMALKRNDNDVEAAANLFEQWCVSDSQIREDLLKPLVRHVLEERLRAKLPDEAPVV